MRTIVAGVRALRAAPLALLPFVGEGLVVGALIGFGAFAASGSSAPAAALFPLDVFFDLKRSLTFGREWTWVIAAAAFAVLVRGAVLAATLWLAEERRGSFALAWGRSSRLVLFAAVALFPSAVLFFTGVALRYAPLIWVAGLIGALVSFLFLRRAVKLDVGAGEPVGRGVPEGTSFLSYVFLIVGVAAAMSVLGRASPWFAAVLVAFLGPVHALFLLGWRQHLRSETFSGGGLIVTSITVIAVLTLAVGAGYDRFVRSTPPVGRTTEPGVLLKLGGADSTSSTGALGALDPRDLGFPRGRSKIVSYRGVGQPYEASHTHRDLDRVAEIVSQQIAVADDPTVLVGHSQAGLILDRVLERDLPAPDRSMMLAAPPPRPPDVDVPPPGQEAVGKPGGDAARAVSRVLDALGLQGFDLDSPASPTNLEPVVVERSSVPRLHVWAIGDSVWLDGDWRRPGEINVVVFSDHVGVVNNGRTADVMRAFIDRRRIDSDESSWRGFAASALSYFFDPWRP